MLRALDVHLDLMARLRDRVRTIPARPVPEGPNDKYIVRSSGKGGKRPPEEIARLNRRVVALKAYGLDRNEIAEALGISTGTVDSHLTGRTGEKYRNHKPSRRNQQC